MSQDKRLFESELNTNKDDILSFEEKRRSEIQKRLDTYRHAQAQIDESPSREESVLSPLYKKRDDAFFNYMDAMRKEQLPSTALLLRDYRNELAKPTAEEDEAIHSGIDTYDTTIDAYLNDIKAYRVNKETSRESLQNLRARKRKIETQMGNLVIPQLLTFVKEWFPLVFSIYQFFNPKNILDQIINAAKALNNEFISVSQEIASKTKKFESNEAYDQVSDEEIEILQKKQDAYLKLVETKSRIDAGIAEYQTPGVTESYETFKQNPSKLNLILLAEKIIERNHTDQKLFGNAPLKDILSDLTILYPEMKQEVDDFSFHLTIHLERRSIFEQLRQETRSLINKHKILSKERKTRSNRIKEIDAELSKTITRPTEMLNEVSKYIPSMVSKFVPDAVSAGLSEFIADSSIVPRERLEAEKKEDESFLSRTYETFKKREALIKKIESFFKLSDTKELNAEMLIEIYQNASNNQDSTNTSELLQQLYPETIAQVKTLSHMQEERVTKISSSRQNEIVIPFLRELIALEDPSKPSKPIGHSIAKPLQSFLREPTWLNYQAIKEEVTANLNYNNKTLRAFFKQIMDLCMPPNTSAAIQLNRPWVQSTGFFKKAPERIIVISEALQELNKEVNYYNIRFQSETLDTEEHISAKSQCIVALHSKLMSYIITLHTQSGTDKTTIDALKFSLQSLMPPSEESTQRLREAIKTINHQDPIHIAVTAIIHLIAGSKQAATIDPESRKADFLKIINNTIAGQNHRITQQNRFKQSELQKNTLHWNAEFALRSTIKKYLREIESIPTTADSIEREALSHLLENITKAADIIRYHPEDSTQLTSTLEDIQRSCEALTGHPVNTAITFILEHLEQTTEYKKIHPQPPAFRK